MCQALTTPISRICCLVVSAWHEPCIRFTGLAQFAKYTYYSLSERRMAPQPPANSQGLTLPKQLRRRETS